MTLRRAATMVAAVVAAGILAGCVQMPTDGPVVKSPVSAAVQDLPGISYDPRPPRRGQSGIDIVDGFLEAMKATPISKTVARQFLSVQAQKTWVPEERIITYVDLGATTGVEIESPDEADLGSPDSTTAMSVTMSGVNLYDYQGAWERTQLFRQLDISLVQENGEWRIDALPDALVVPESWFDDWYRRVSLYFFDPTTEVLVPEPVFVPKGEQFTSAVVRGLLAEPTGESAQVARTYFPPGTKQALSVPINSAGVAEVALTGDPDTVDELTAERMLAQLVWTLGQEPLIRGVRLSVGGRVFDSTDGSNRPNLDVGRGYDPNGVRSTGELFALRGGMVVRGSLESLEVTTGPFGQTDLGVRSIGVNLSGSRVGAVSSDGTRVDIAPLETPDAEVVPVISDGVNLQPPVWDFRDRAWVLDRNGGRARILLVVDGAVREVTVPRVSGRRVTQILVSRDSSRFVAVVRGPKADRVVASRIQHDEDGRVLRVTAPVPLAIPIEDGPRVRDVGWRSPTTVSLLSDPTEGFSQVRTLSVDGSPGEIATAGTSRLRGAVRALVTAPQGTEVFAVVGREVTNLSQPERAVVDLPRGVTSLTFAG